MNDQGRTDLALNVSIVDERRNPAVSSADFSRHSATLDAPAPRIDASDKQVTKAASKYVYLDVARGIAAFLVLADHLRAFVFKDFFTVGHVSVMWKPFYLLTSLGQPAVLIFFVLSGFLITKNISQLHASNRWSWLQYGMKRLSRLWIVLLPALLLTFAWDRLGIDVTHSALYRGDLDSVYHSVPMTALSYSIQTALGNTVFLQTILVPAFGSNGPLWSLANEFWYYVIFPLGFIACQRQTALSMRIIFALAAIALCVWLPRHLTLLGVVWLMGYGAYLMVPIARRIPTKVHAVLAIAGVALAFVCIVLTKSGRLYESSSDYAIGLSFTITLVALTQLSAPRWVEAAATLFSEFSYTLYLVHFPLLAFIFSFVLHNSRFAPGLRGLMIFAVAFVVATVYAYAIYWMFERNTGAIQRRLGRWIDSKQHSPI